MGSFRPCQERIKIFCRDTLSSFCNEILEFSCDFRLQGSLHISFDKEYSIDFNIDEQRECRSESASKLLTLELAKYSLQVGGISRFIKAWFISLCRNIVTFQCECSISGEVCITLDKEKAVLIEIQEHLLPLDSSTDSSSTELAVSSLNDVEPLSTSRSSPPAACSVSRRKRKQLNPLSLRSHGVNKQSKTLPLLNNDSASADISVKSKMLPLLSNENSSADISVKSAAGSDIKPSELMSNNNLAIHYQLPDNHRVNSLCSAENLTSSQLTEFSSQLPLIVQLLQNSSAGRGDAAMPAVKVESHSFNADNTETNTISDAGNCEDNKPALLEAKNLSLDGSVRQSRTCVKNSDTVAVTEPTHATASSSSSVRGANTLLSIPDNDVHQMLMRLVTAGQAKDSCEANRCKICCPTLAYIRFRDRNRKNKSRFSMQKIEQVVNVSQYGGGTKYRDVQRMFTTHLRKLRSQHMCDKQCPCCRVLLTRESKKPNSNYLPHNVTPTGRTTDVTK